MTADQSTIDPSVGDDDYTVTEEDEYDPSIVDWQPRPANFSTPFIVEARSGKLWIRTEWEGTPFEELRLNGVNWAGFQASGCVHELWKYNVTEYVNFIASNGFNAVRLPLSAPIVAWALHGDRWGQLPQAAGQEDGRAFRSIGRCGDYNGMLSLHILDDVLQRLRNAGIFVMLDMHTVSFPEGNNANWCDADPCDGASDAGTANERLIFDAWEIIARRYCRYPNVILADVFK